MHHPTDRITHTTAVVKPVVVHWLKREITQWVHHEGSIRLMLRWVVGSILHGVDSLSYVSFQPDPRDWCNKGRGMCYPVCGMVHIKRVAHVAAAGFLSHSEWYFIICAPPYNHKNVLSASLNKAFPLHKKGWKSFYLSTHSTHVIYGYMSSDI